MCTQHVSALRELLLGAAVADGACAAGPAEGALQRQLVVLLARLLRAAAHDGPLQGFTSDIRAQARTTPLVAAGARPL